jgi:segregation and condensation protein A
MDYEVKLDQFEGPLDLLLYLIRKQEINIYDIPISRITEQYLEYIKMLKFLNLELAGEFLVMAATLMRIKARMLLPRHDEAEDEEEDPREQLVRQLLEYQRFKGAATKLESMEYQRKLLFTRPESEVETDTTEVEYSFSLFDLISAFKVVLEKAKVRYLEVEADETSIEDKIEFLKQKIAEAETIAFEDLFEGRSTAADLISTFLAMLEILRLGLATVRQAKPFSRIYIHRVAKENADGGT